MTLLDAALLGLLQGFTEFIPVSSSGHLIIAAHLLGLSEDTFSFDVALHVGTLAALLVYFAPDLRRLLRDVKHYHPLLRLILISTLPAVILGYLLQSTIEAHTRAVGVVITTLIAVGILMCLADRWHGRKQMMNLAMQDAVFIGFAQSLALIPGVSRSGSTILAGKMRGMDYRAATRYSFLLAIPVTLGATIKVVTNNPELLTSSQSRPYVLVGVLAAFVGGITAIHFMLKMLQRIGLKWFGVYRIGLASLLLLLLVTGVIS